MALTQSDRAKIEYLKGVLTGIIGQVQNNTNRRTAVARLRNVKNQIEARESLGEPLDMTKFAGLYAECVAAVETAKSLNVNVPTQSEVTTKLAELS